MRKSLATSLIACFLSMTLLAVFPLDADAKRVRVRGYYRKDGTYVKPHYRTAPDGNPYNNYSYPGNFNPNTGKVKAGDPQIYLDRYYNKQSSYSLPRTYSRTYTPSLNRSRSTVSPGYTYVKPHRRTVPDGNPYNNYSYPRNYNPNTGKITTGSPQTYLDRYYSKPKPRSNSHLNFGLETGSNFDSIYVSPYLRSTPSATAPSPNNPPFGTSTDSPDSSASSYDDAFNLGATGYESTAPSFNTTPSFDLSPGLDTGLSVDSLWDF